MEIWKKKTKKKKKKSDKNTSTFYEGGWGLLKGN